MTAPQNEKKKKPEDDAGPFAPTPAPNKPEPESFVDKGIAAIKKVPGQVDDFAHNTAKAAAQTALDIKSDKHDQENPIAAAIREGTKGLAASLTAVGIEATRAALHVTEKILETGLKAATGLAEGTVKANKGSGKDSNDLTVSSNAPSKPPSFIADATSKQQKAAAEKPADLEVETPKAKTL